MRIQLKHVRGSRAGEVQTFSSRLIRIGRHPSCDVVFDPVSDNLASKFHAEVHLEDGEFVVYDKGSKNGTFVNGERVERATLKDGDILEFGPGGPQLRFAADIGSKTMMAMFRDLAAAGRARGAEATGFGKLTIFMKEMVNQAVQESSRKFKVAIAAVSVGSLLVIGALLYTNYETQQRYQRALNAMSQELQRFDQLSTDLLSARTRLAEAKEKLAAESRNIAALEAALQRGEENRAVIRTRLLEARKRQEALAAELAQDTEVQVLLSRQLRDANRRLAEANRTLAELDDQKVDWDEVLSGVKKSVVLVRVPLQVSGKRVFAEACGVVLPPGDQVLTTAQIARALQSPAHLAIGEAAVVFRDRTPQKPYVIEGVVSVYSGSQSSGMSILRLENANLPARAPLATTEELDLVRRGEPVASLGLRGVETLALDPVIQPGWVQSVSSYSLNDGSEVNLVQHSAVGTAALPGTPLFNAAGKIIGINGVLAASGGRDLRSSAPMANHWAVRIDAMKELVRLPLTASNQ